MGNFTPSLGTHACIVPKYKIKVKEGGVLCAGNLEGTPVAVGLASASLISS